MGAVMEAPRGAADPSLHRAPLCSLDVSLEENDTVLVFSSEDGSMADEVCLDDVHQSRLSTEVLSGAVDPSLHRTLVSSEDGSMEDDAFVVDVNQTRLLRILAVIVSSVVSHTEILRGAIDPSLHRALDSIMEDFLVDVNQTRLLRIVAAMVSYVVSHTEILRGAIDPSLHRALDSIMEDFLVEVRQTRLHLLRLAQR